jgi:hypothetical protein
MTGEITAAVPNGKPPPSRPRPQAAFAVAVASAQLSEST